MAGKTSGRMNFHLIEGASGSRPRLGGTAYNQTQRVRFTTSPILNTESTGMASNNPNAGAKAGRPPKWEQIAEKGPPLLDELADWTARMRAALNEMERSVAAAGEGHKLTEGGVTRTPASIHATIKTLAAKLPKLAGRVVTFAEQTRASYEQTAILGPVAARKAGKGAKVTAGVKAAAGTGTS